MVISGKSRTFIENVGNKLFTLAILNNLSDKRN